MLEFLRDLKQAYEEGLIEKSEVFHVLLNVDIYAYEPNCLPFSVQDVQDGNYMRWKRCR